MVSIHDVAREAEKPGTPQIEWRRQRARNATLLGLHLHERRIATLSLAELGTVLMRVVPNDEDSLEGYFVRHFLHFVHERLLTGWAFKRVEGTEELSGTAADDAYLQLAHREGLVLVTNEDLTPAGIRSTPKKGSLRAKAKSRGVRVRTPKGLIAEAGVDRASLTDAFFARWDKAARAYMADHSLEHPGDDIETWMEDVRRMYDWILRG